MSIIQKMRQILQSFLEAVQRVTNFILGAFMRIFRATDDKYPASGVQPFEGEPFDKKNHNHKQVL